MPFVDNAWYVNFGDGANTGYWAVPSWGPSTVKVVGDVVRRPSSPAVTIGNERVFVCVVGGTTGSVEPTWVITRGGKTTDGTVTWEEATGVAGLNADIPNTPAWAAVAGTAVLVGQVVKSADGTKLLICTTAGTTRNLLPTPSAYTPLDNSRGVSPITDLTVYFDDTVALGTSGTITLKRTSDNATIKVWNVATDAGSAAGKVEILFNQTLYLHLTTSLAIGVEYYVIWDAGVVRDQGGLLVPAQTSTTLWSFTTAPLSVIANYVLPSDTGLSTTGARTYMAGDSYFTDVAPVYMLDMLGYLPAKAYSMRKLRNGAGLAIRIRRSSDNTEQDIGFVGEDLDRAAITAFVGANSAYLTKWYDQGGKGSDLTQPTQANQPRIVNAGVLDVRNARPTPFFTKTTSYMETPDHTDRYIAEIDAVIATTEPGPTWPDAVVAVGDDSFLNATLMSDPFYAPYNDYMPEFGIINVNGGPNLTVFGGVLHQVRLQPNGGLHRGTFVGAAWNGSGYPGMQGWYGEFVLWEAPSLSPLQLPIVYNSQIGYWNRTPYLLDYYAPPALAAYSFRKLRSAYTGSAVRIRRSSDNAELNIGFASNGDFDTAAAAAHIGAGTGYIVTWFDQSGRGMDVTQATVSQQPTYLATGLSGKPTALLVAASSQFWFKTGVTNVSLPAVTTTIMIVSRELVASGTNGIFGWLGGPDRWALDAAYLNTIYWDNPIVARLSVPIPAGWAGFPHVVEVGRDLQASDRFITVDGIELARGARAQWISTGTANWVIGQNPATGSYGGYISEFVMWASDLGADRALARANVQVYWTPALLDIFPTATMAYSFRKLRSAYTGAAVRIRRSSDNAEADIGFTINGDFDKVTAATHIGAGTGFVVTWYDQSGNGLDVTQTTAANQPTYVAAGMYSKPTMDFDGTNDRFARASVANTSLPLDTTTVMSVLFNDDKLAVGSIQSVVFDWRVAYPTNWFSLQDIYLGAMYFGYGNVSSGQISVAPPTGWTLGSSGHILEVGREDAGDYQFITTDGVERVRTAGRTALPAAGTAIFDVGSVGGSYPFDGLMSELVVWAADLAANRVAARTNVTTYWINPTFLLDLYPVATMAYSFRKLRAAYFGAAVRIRRASDNVELDIGFTANGDFDTAAAAAHIGVSTGLIVTWYDQSGNGLDVTQATVSLQPMYSASGMNSKPTMIGDGSNDILARASVSNTSLPVDTTTIITVVSETGGSSNQGLFGWEATSATNRFALFDFGTGLYFDNGNNTAAGNTSVTKPANWQTRGGRLIEVGREDAGDFQFETVDGVELVRTGGRTALPTSGSAAFQVMGWTPSGYFTGLMSELVIWAADLAANRAAARKHVQTYWNTPSILLDTFPVASMAYSFRKLRSAYAGSAVRIRRSSDNAEANIGFVAATGDFDTAAAATHIGAGTGYIVTWFDQSGNGLDVTQATAANQPTYSATGMYSKPTMVFADTTDTLVRASVANTSLPPVTTTVMDVMMSNPGNNQVFSWVISASNLFELFASWASASIYFDFGNTGVSRLQVTLPAGFDGVGHLVEVGRQADNDQFVTVDGVEAGRIVSQVARPTPTTGTASFGIGTPFSGMQSELVIWAADLASYRTAARTNIQKYWINPTLLLDVVGATAVRAYSTRKLRSAYTGSAIRIRRSSDNTEQDIGFVGENLDTAAITTFVGANSAYVVTWYDQSGNADNATQATAASQPRIVNAGTLDVRNNRPAPLFDGTNDVLTSAVSLTVAEASALFATTDVGDWGTYRGGVDGSGSGNVQAGLAGFIGTGGAYITGTVGNSAFQNASVNNSSSTIAVFGSVLHQVRADGNGVAWTSVQIGDIRGQALYWTGWIGETVLFATALSAGKRNAMYANQATYWGMFLLDQLGVPAARAYSTRKLRAAHTGAAIRIRRSNDNAETDIGFIAENLDTAAITTFVGANSAYVTVWYDQSGTGDNATQPTASKQARIVNAGTLDVRNGKAAPLFDGVDDSYVSGASFTRRDYSAVAAVNEAGPNFGNYYGVISDGVTTAIMTGGAGTPGFFETTVVNGGPNVATFGGTLMQLRGTAGGAIVSTGGLRIGSEHEFTARWWPGWITETVIFPTLLSGSVSTALYTNQSTYWGILLIDQLGVPATRAYSTRKLRAAYTGSAIRIRRSSDNAEQDIGFAGIGLDTAAITTFVGSNSAFVVKMYDQSGNADDMVQATAGSQPRIVNAGTLDVRNGKAAPYYNGTSSVMAASTPAAMQTFGVVSALDYAGPTAGNNYAALTMTVTWGLYVIGNGTALWLTSGPMATPSIDGGGNTVVFGGVLNNGRASQNPGAPSLILQMGQYLNLVGSYNWLGWIPEVVSFATQLSAPNYATLYTNQKGYWGTP